MPPLASSAIPIGPLASLVTEALAGELVGLYLYGSVVSGGFDPGVSDIDLVAVTTRDAALLDLDALDRVHRAFVSDHPAWEDRIEVLYIGADTLRNFRSAMADLAVISPGEALHLSGPVRDWLQNWYLVRESGVALTGKPAQGFFPEIDREEYLSAVTRYAAWLAGRDLHALAPGALAYTVLSLCRALRTVRTRQPCSKQDGAAWVADHIPDHAALIDAALACRLARGGFGFDDPAQRTAAIDLVRSLAAAIANPR